MTKFFEVTAKCGHVGKGYYYEGVFYEIAESATEAAKIVRQRGRVKHDHKDAILDVIEIDKKAFIDGRLAKLDNLYFICKNKQEQNLIFEQIADRIKCEPVREDDENYSEKRKSRVQYKLKKYKQLIESYDEYYDQYAC